MTIGVLGAGAWGTALSLVAADAGHSVTLWAREADVVVDVNTHHRNQLYLPGVALPHSIKAVDDLRALANSDIIILSVPTQHIRSTLQGATDIVAASILVDVSKGIERGTHLRVSEILDDIGAKSKAYVVLSGPSHAEEVGRRLPTAVVAASSDATVSEYVQKALSTDTFRIYTSDDVIGVEICGALKNVIAIAAGIIDTMVESDNTKAALLTRGLAEMMRLGVALGGQPATFAGLAGLGDLFVTCTSRHSRNRSVGEQLGRGRTLSDILDDMTAVAEGVPTTTAALELASTVGVDMPITAKVASILFEGEDPATALRDLMIRPYRAE